MLPLPPALMMHARMSTTLSMQVWPGLSHAKHWSQGLLIPIGGLPNVVPLSKQIEGLEKFRSNPSANNGHAYDQAASNSRNCLKRAKVHVAFARSLKGKLTSGNMSDKQWWSSVKRAAGVGCTSDLPTLTDEAGNDFATNLGKAECLAEYFAGKCTLGERDFQNDYDLPSVHFNYTSRICNVCFCPSTVERILRHLDASKATGPDGISATVLKMCATELAAPLARLFFTRGCQPTHWKIANAVPFTRKSPSHLPRTIALFPFSRSCQRW